VNRLYIKGFLDITKATVLNNKDSIILEFEFYTKRATNRQKIMDVHFCRLYGEKKIKEFLKIAKNKKTIVLECEVRPNKSIIDDEVFNSKSFLDVKTFH
jgi:hypothetical protein